MLNAISDALNMPICMDLADAGTTQDLHPFSATDMAVDGAPQMALGINIWKAEPHL